MIEDDDSPVLIEAKFASNCISQLEFISKFMLDNCAFPMFTDDFYLAVRTVHKSIQELRSNYINQIKFINYD